MIKNLVVRSIWSLKILTAYLNLPVRLVQWTGKSPHPVHPKHLIGNSGQEWYLKLLRPEDRVLDIGCANGMHTLACAEKCRQVFGFDADPAHLHIARSLAQEHQLDNVFFQQANAEKSIPFSRQAFDKIIFLDVLEHLYKRDEALEEVRRVLKASSGRLFLAVPNRDTSWKRLRREVGLFPFADPDHKVEYTRQEIVATLEQHGFVCEQFLPITYDTPWEWAIHILGSLSLPVYRRLQNWRHAEAERRPEESTGFLIVARTESEMSG